MAEGKNSFVLYVDTKETWEELTNEQAGKLIKHVFRYVNDEDPQCDDPLIKIAFLPIKQSLKRDLNKWKDKQEERKVSGKMGNLKRWHPDLHSQVIDGKIDMVDALNIANDRKTSLSDKSDRCSSLGVANIAVSGSVSGSVSKENKTVFSFDEFWNIYPVKKQKKDCAKKYEKIKEEDRAKIKETIKAFIYYKPFESYSHPNPSTYLNQERWNDEIQPIQKDINEYFDNYHSLTAEQKDELTELIKAIPAAERSQREENHLFQISAKW